jgi:hypothetical protein
VQEQAQPEPGEAAAERVLAQEQAEESVPEEQEVAEVGEAWAPVVEGVTADPAAPAEAETEPVVVAQAEAEGAPAEPEGAPEAEAGGPGEEAGEEVAGEEAAAEDSDRCRSRAVCSLRGLSSGSRTTRTAASPASASHPHWRSSLLGAAGTRRATQPSVAQRVSFWTRAFSPQSPQKSLLRTHDGPVRRRVPPPERGTPDSVGSWRAAARKASRRPRRRQSGRPASSSEKRCGCTDGASGQRC